MSGNKPVYRCLSKKDRIDLAKWKQNRASKRKKRFAAIDLDRQADELRRKDYNAFLKSKYWEVVRKRVLKRDNFKCVWCGSNKKLQVHHESYKYHFREHRHLKHLISLCERCHDGHHYRINKAIEESIEQDKHLRRIINSI